MKKTVTTTIILIVATLFSFATDKGFKAKVYDENNSHFMTLTVDYTKWNIKINTPEFEQDYKVLFNYSTEDKSILYFDVIQVQLFNNENYDKSKVETLIFNLKKSTFSSKVSKTDFKCDFYLME